VATRDGPWVDGIDTPAVFRPSNPTFYFRPNTQGNAYNQFTWGPEHLAAGTRRPRTRWLATGGNHGRSFVS